MHHNYDWAFTLPVSTEAKCMNPALVYEVNINETKKATQSASQGRKGIQAKKSDYVLTCTGKDKNNIPIVVREDKLKSDWDQQVRCACICLVKEDAFHHVLFANFRIGTRLSDVLGPFALRILLMHTDVEP